MLKYEQIVRASLVTIYIESMKTITSNHIRVLLIKNETELEKMNKNRQTCSSYCITGPSAYLCYALAGISDWVFLYAPVIVSVDSLNTYAYKYTYT